MRLAVEGEILGDDSFMSKIESGTRSTAPDVMFVVECEWISD
jgi:hypothetical protein